MSKTVSSRLNEEEVKILNQIAKEEHMNRSSLIRKFLLSQIEQFQMKKMANFYRKGIVSLQEAAYQAKVTIYQMMEYLEANKIFPPPQSDEEIQQDINRSERIFKKIIGNEKL